MNTKPSGLAAVAAAALSSTSAAAIEANLQPRADAAPAAPAADAAPAAATAAAPAGGAADERARVKAIIGSDAAKGRETLAQHLAFNTDMSAESAVATLEASPKAEAARTSRLDAAMASHQPRVDSEEVSTGKEAATASLAAAVSRMIEKQFGKDAVPA